MRNACHANVPSKMCAFIFNTQAAGVRNNYCTLRYLSTGTAACIAWRRWAQNAQPMWLQCQGHNYITQYGRARKRVCHSRLGT